MLLKRTVAIPKDVFFRLGEDVNGVLDRHQWPVLLAGVTAAFLLGACHDDRSPTEPTPQAGEVGSTDRSGHSDKPAGEAVQHFYFLPPVAPQPDFSGEFDPSVEDYLSVLVCELDSEANPITPCDRVPVELDGNAYKALWSTQGLPPGLYQINVGAGVERYGVIEVALTGKGKGKPQENAYRLSRTIPIRFRVEKGLPEAEFRLSVVSNEGVEGHPESGELLLDPGETVQYSYAAAPGFENPVVLIDGERAPASGTIVMTQNHTLRAGATRVIDPGPETDELDRIVRNFEDSSDPQALFQAGLAEVERLYDELGNDAARSAVAELEAAYLADAELRDLLLSLAQDVENQPFGDLQAQTSSLQSEVALSSTQSVSSATLSASVAIVYVNGVWNSPLDAWSTRAEIARIAEANNIDAPVGLFYNHSSLNDLDECIFATSIEAWLKDAMLDVSSRLVRCEIEARVEDLEEASGQVANLQSGFTNEVAADAEDLAKYLRDSVLGAGFKVVLVGHSQGDLMIQEALFGTETLSTKDRAKIGVVSIGAPQLNFTPNIGAFKSLLHEYEVFDLATRWRELGGLFGHPHYTGNLTTPTTTRLSQTTGEKWHDAQVTCLESWFFRLFSCARETGAALASSIGLHKMSTGYLEAEGTRNVIASALVSQVAALRSVGSVFDVVIAPDSATVAVSDTAALSATGFDSDGEEVSGATFTWTSSDAAVATVSATGEVAGLAEGTVRVTATAESGVADSAVVTVAAAGNQPPTVSISAPADGSTFSEGDPIAFDGSASDPDGSIASVTWRSDRDGELSSFLSFTQSDLSVGNHTITLKATDDGGASSTDQVNVSIGSTTEDATWSTISSGGNVTCGVTPAGDAYCWGWNPRGQIGDGSTQDSPTPVAVAGGHQWVQVSVGTRHTCGVTTSGAIYCWGANGAGQLGNGSTDDSTVPVLVTGGLSWKSVSAASSHSCGVTLNGLAYCWGNNDQGKLGNGSTNDSSSPVLVSGGYEWSRVRAGLGRSCGITSGQDLYCWGGANLGDGSLSDSSNPVLVSGGHEWSGVSLHAHSCGTTTGKDAFCWGSDQDGKLGIGPSTGDQQTPVLVVGGHDWSHVSAGFSHTCGVSVTGDAFCWGENADGQLGDGSTNATTTPIPVTSGHAWKALSAGLRYTCGVNMDGVGYCWGDNEDGQFGNGTTSGSTTPVPVSDPAE